MKSKVILSLLLLMSTIVFISSCTKDPYIVDGSVTTTIGPGQINYTANPFDLKDSILCLNNIRYVYVNGSSSNTEYYKYILDLLDNYEGTIYFPTYEGNKLFNIKEWRELDMHPYNYSNFEFVSAVDITMFPTIDGNFISVMDKQNCCLVDSLIFEATRVIPSIEKYIVVFYTRKRDQDSSSSAKVYLNDYVKYCTYFERSWPNTYSPFITDTIIPDNEQVICFDAQFGPKSVNSF